MMLTKEDIKDSLHILQLENSTICLHSSFRSFGPVKDSPSTIIDAFTELGNTLLVPSFTYECQTIPPKGKSYRQNGIDLSHYKFQDDAISFNREDHFISRGMGIVAATLLRQPNRERGEHPVNSFAALGPAAKNLVGTQSPLNVYAPYKKLYGNNNGYIVLAGVDLTSCTPVHFAEEMAGRNLFRIWAKDRFGNTIEAEVGSCSNGFRKLNEYVREIVKTITIGNSYWRIFPFNDFIDQLSTVIEQNPEITHCDNENCARCNDAVKGGPILEE